MFLVCVFCHRSCPDCSHIVLYLLNVVLTRCYIYYMFSLLRTRSFFFVANFKFLCTKENKLLSCFCLFLFLFCLFVFSQILSKLLFFMNPCPICLHYILTSCREMVTMFVIEINEHDLGVPFSYIRILFTRICAYVIWRKMLHDVSLDNVPTHGKSSRCSKVFENFQFFLYISYIYMYIFSKNILNSIHVQFWLKKKNRKRKKKDIHKCGIRCRWFY